MEKTAKKNTWLIAVLSVVLLLSVAAGVTAATITKGLEKRANEFTFGNLSIELTEPGWDGLADEDRITYPGRSIIKDPRVRNTGGTDAYLYLTVSIPRAVIQTVNADQTINSAADMELFSYTVNGGWTQIGTPTLSGDGKYSEYIYAYTVGAVAPGESTPTLFDRVTFVNALEGQPEMGTKLNILVTATGIQSGYLNESGDTVAEKIINAYQISLAQAG